MKPITICFDMDGTIADLYANENWLADLREYNPRPYKTARPLVNMNTLARTLNTLHRNGFRIEIISWLSKCSTADYDMAVTSAKIAWLKKHLGSVEWDAVNIVPYGTPKSAYADGNAILFDDEARNRDEWRAKGMTAYDEKNIIEILKNLLTNAE